jgi:hypothetical protein
VEVAAPDQRAVCVLRWLARSELDRGEIACQLDGAPEGGLGLAEHPLRQGIGGEMGQNEPPDAGRLRRPTGVTGRRVSQAMDFRTLGAEATRLVDQQVGVLGEPIAPGSARLRRRARHPIAQAQRRDPRSPMHAEFRGGSPHLRSVAAHAPLGPMKDRRIRVPLDDEEPGQPPLEPR